MAIVIKTKYVYCDVPNQIKCTVTSAITRFVKANWP